MCVGIRELPPLVRGRVSARALTTLGTGNYPRSCGEEEPLSNSMASSPELPPLVRGRASFATKSGLNTGITPARAGKRQRLCSCRSFIRNYPRSCGEEYQQPLVYLCLAELPPLVRGRALIVNETAQQIGITPARAGKSAVGEENMVDSGNYPRSCGEESLDELVVKADKELPPLVRGRDARAGGRHDIRGITPARAGKSHFPVSNPCPSRNYPRSCGEETVRSPRKPWPAELPPLVRGRGA